MGVGNKGGSRGIKGIKWTGTWHGDGHTEVHERTVTWQGSLVACQPTWSTIAAAHADVVQQPNLACAKTWVGMEERGVVGSRMHGGGGSGE